MNNNYILSYINPDTDGVACSIAYSFLLSKLKKEMFIPAVIGKIGYETEYVLKKLNIEYPHIITKLSNDVSSIILVDTHHVLQLPSNFPFEKVRLVIDHHPNGDDDRFPNAYIDNRNIGAAASIIAERFFEANVYDEKMLKLLAMAIVSNTLNFSAPSTTPFDENIYNKISKLYSISEEIVNSMLTERSKVLLDNVKSSLLSDIKHIESTIGQLCISQLEVFNLLQLINFNYFMSSLKKIEDEMGVICIFNGVDILKKQTIVMCASKEGKMILQKLFNLPFNSNYEIFDRILLRKTDYLPKLSSLKLVKGV